MSTVYKEEPQWVGSGFGLMWVFTLQNGPYRGWPVLHDMAMNQHQHAIHHTQTQLNYSTIKIVQLLILAFYFNDI